MLTLPMILEPALRPTFQVPDCPTLHAPDCVTAPITFAPAGRAVCKFTLTLCDASTPPYCILVPSLKPIAVPVAGNAAVKLEDVPPLAPPAATFTLRFPLASR